MRGAQTVSLAVLVLVLAGCGDESPEVKTQSGVTGRVRLGPQCPVENADNPCEDLPAAHVDVTLSEQVLGDTDGPGKVVARGTTNADGAYNIVVAPGDYVITADAGMSCDLMDAHVTDGAFAQVDIACDTGIR